MTFIDFQKQTECCQSQFNENVPSKSINRKSGHSTTLGYLMCRKFCAPHYLKISMLS